MLINAIPAVNNHYQDFGSYTNRSANTRRRLPARVNNSSGKQRTAQQRVVRRELDGADTRFNKAVTALGRIIDAYA